MKDFWDKFWDSPIYVDGEPVPAYAYLRVLCDEFTAAIKKTFQL